jgi:hypothetical protein
MWQQADAVGIDAAAGSTDQRPGDRCGGSLVGSGFLQAFMDKASDILASDVAT